MDHRAGNRAVSKRTAVDRENSHSHGNLSVLGIKCFIMLACMTGIIHAHSTYKVLILDSFDRGYYWSDVPLDAMQETFDQSDLYIEPFYEHMDTKHTAAEDISPHLKQLYKSKYQNRHLDAIITSNNNALLFILQNRDSLFPDVPVIFCGVDQISESAIAGHKKITGIFQHNNYKSTVQTALGLHPRADKVIILGNEKLGWFDSWKDELPEIRQQFGTRAEFIPIELSQMKQDDCLRRLEQVGDSSVVILLTQFKRNWHEFYSVGDTIDMIYQRCKAPVYVIWEPWLGQGPVGGSLVSGDLQGRTAAQMAIQIFKGTGIEDLPIVKHSPNKLMFDYNKLKDFHLSIASLPQPSIVINEPQSFYYQYKTIIWPTIIVLTVLSTMVIILSVNIVRRKQTEEKLKNSEIKLQKLNAELETNNTELERFAYTVSHDLKSPLITIRGFLKMLRKDIMSNRSNHIDADLDRITYATAKMEQLLDGVLQLSRVQASTELNTDVSLYEIAQEAAALLTGSVTKRGVRLEISPDLPTIWANRQRLLQLFQNLIENAVKFMSDQSDPYIEIGARVENDKTVCYVKDNGRGIDPEFQEKVFGLFNQLSNDSSGIGVGLALVKRIVENHGGTIWIESQGAGHGTTFCFTIPPQNTPLL